MASIHPAALNETARIIADLLGGARRGDSVGPTDFSRLAARPTLSASGASTWRSAALWQGPCLHLLLQDQLATGPANPGQAISAYRAWTRNDLSIEGLEYRINLTI